MKIIDQSNYLPWCKPHVDFLQSLWDSSIMVDVTFLCTKIHLRILFEKMIVSINYIMVFICIKPQVGIVSSYYSCLPFRVQASWQRLTPMLQYSLFAQSALDRHSTIIKCTLDYNIRSQNYIKANIYVLKNIQTSVIYHVNI